MDERLRERGLVEHRDVPRDEHDEPERDGDGRPEEERQRRPEPGASRERREQVPGEEEHRERPSHREQRERHAEVGDQHVLEHVGRLEVLLGDRVERREEAHEQDGDPGEEERDSRPRRELGAASVESSPAPEEERDRDRRRRQHERVERPRGPEVVGRSRPERGHRPTVALEGAWLEARHRACPRQVGSSRRIRLRPDPAWRASVRRAASPRGLRARGRARGPGCGRAAPARAPR